MNDVKINYYEVQENTPMWEIDEMNKVALPIGLKEGRDVRGKNVWTVDKGQYVKSFGQTRNLKSTSGKKEEFLLLVNGNGILMKDVALFKDEVDDCGCDGNPIATPTDLSKLNETEAMEHKEIDKESAYVNKKSSFTKGRIAGVLLGAAIGAAIMWFSTKDKKKTIIGAIAGAVLGLVISYFIGRRGTKKLETMSKLEEIEKEAKNPTVETVKAGTENPKAASEEQSFFQLGETYEFSIPYPIYAMTYEDNTFYVATDKNKGNVIIKPNTRVKGKLVEVKEPEFFVADPATKKVVKIKSKKPLPFLDLGNKMYVPLSVSIPTSMISPEEAMRFLNEGQGLDEEIYVKGRYAGKRFFNLMYMPAHAVILKKKFGTA
jgi:F0F1-type ATP synthase assembly protein I